MMITDDNNSQLPLR